MAGLEEALCFPLDDRSSPYARANLTNDTSRCTTEIVNSTGGVWRKPPRIVRFKKGRGVLAHGFTLNLLDGESFRKNEFLMRNLVGAIATDRSELNATATTNSVGNPTPNDKASLDTLIFLFPSGHVLHEKYTTKVLAEVVAAASDIFSATSVIFQTIV
mmetsp:Transcript_49821/g.149847  ORF Transcript_49821/g.149847 Transcript_49821/m.149847 type:complete len:159 (-) Transcript_49821:692-1168(-)